MAFLGGDFNSDTMMIGIHDTTNSEDVLLVSLEYKNLVQTYLHVRCPVWSICVTTNPFSHASKGLVTFGGGGM